MQKLWAKKEVSPQQHYQRSLTQPLQHLISNSTKAAVFRHQCQGAWGFRFFGWGLCSFANYSSKTSRTVGCHVIWNILLQLGWGFKITWYHTMSSWESRTRVPLQALPGGSQQQSQEVKSQLPRPRLASSPSAITRPEGLQDPWLTSHQQTPQASKNFPSRKGECCGSSLWHIKGFHCYPWPNHSAPIWSVGSEKECTNSTCHQVINATN